MATQAQIYAESPEAVGVISSFRLPASPPLPTGNSVRNLLPIGHFSGLYSSSDHDPALYQTWVRTVITAGMEFCAARNFGLVVGSPLSDASSLPKLFECEAPAVIESNAKTDQWVSSIEQLRRMVQARLLEQQKLRTSFYPAVGASDNSAGIDLFRESSTASSGWLWTSIRPQALPSWVVKVVQLDGERQFHKALMEVTRETERVKRAGSQELFMRELKSLELTELSEFVLVGLLRNTYSFRSSLPGWYGLRSSIAAELERRELEVDVAILLRGMMDAAREE